MTQNISEVSIRNPLLAYIKAPSKQELYGNQFSNHHKIKLLIGALLGSCGIIGTLASFAIKGFLPQGGLIDKLRAGSVGLSSIGILSGAGFIALGLLEKKELSHLNLTDLLFKGSYYAGAALLGAGCARGIFGRGFLTGLMGACAAGSLLSSYVGATVVDRFEGILFSAATIASTKGGLLGINYTIAGTLLGLLKHQPFVGALLGSLVAAIRGGAGEEKLSFATRMGLASGLLAMGSLGSIFEESLTELLNEHLDERANQRKLQNFCYAVLESYFATLPKTAHQDNEHFLQGKKLDFLAKIVAEQLIQCKTSPSENNLPPELLSQQPSKPFLKTLQKAQKKFKELSDDQKNLFTLRPLSHPINNSRILSLRNMSRNIVDTIHSSLKEEKSSLLEAFQHSANLFSIRS
jgi:hypothetical protein